jgi:hypothetical protein
MKYLLSLAIGLLFSFPSQAATPLSGVLFTNLDRAQFIVNFTGPNTNIVRINSAGIFQGITTTNYYLVGGNGVSVTTTTLGTNVTFTLDSTSLNSLWTNVLESGLHDYYPSQAEDSLQATNIVSQKTLAVNGVLRILTTFLTNLVAGPNNVALDNIGNVKLQSSDPTAQLRLGFGNGDNSLLLLNYVGDGTPLTLLNGDSIWDNPGFHLYLSGGDWTPTNPGETMLLYANPFGWAEVARFGGSTNVLTENLWKFSGGYLQPVDLTQPLFWTNALVMGSGSSILRSGADVTVTNSAVDSKWTLLNNSAKGVSLEAQSSSAVGITTAGSPSSLFLRNGTDQVVLQGAKWEPITDLNIALGDVTGPRWGDAAFGGTTYVSGFLGSPVTNYSRMAISHTGTNGAVVFDSQAAGSAGSPRPIDFDFGGTNILRLTYNSGSITIDNPNNHSITIDQGASGTTLFSNVSGTGTPLTLMGAGIVEVQRNAIASTTPVQTWGLLVQNGSSATAGQQQNSPAVSMIGTGYVTNSATSQSVLFGMYVNPTSGADAPTGRLLVSTVISNGAPVQVFGVDSQGPIVLAKGITKAQKTAIANPANGMIVNQTDNTPGLRAYINGSWVIISTSADP